MPKKIFSTIFAIFLTIFCISPSLTPSAYEVTEFEITAKAGMLVSLDTDEILYENNIDQKVYPASITKIMTTLLILESDKYDPAGKITMTKSALDLVLGTGSSVSYIKEGEEFTQLDLIYLVLMSSYGDCTYLAAEFYAGSVENFVTMMNQKAAELGLENTHYQNPVGLHDENNYTTVRDIYTLTKYALQNETFKTVCETDRYPMPATNMSDGRTLVTTNALQDSNTSYYYRGRAKGVKTGFTDEAGRCLVSTASYNNYNYMCIVMGCPPKEKKHFSDSIALYDWAFNNFSFKEIASSTEPVCEMPVELSLETDFVPLHFKNKFVSVLPNAADDSTIVIKPKLNAESVEAPIKKGDILGKADVIFAEKIIGTVDLVAGADIKESKILIVAKYIKSVFTSIYMKLIIAIAVIAILIFIIICIRLNIAHLKKRKVRYIPYGKKEKGNHGK